MICNNHDTTRITRLLAMQQTPLRDIEKKITHPHLKQLLNLWQESTYKNSGRLRADFLTKDVLVYLVEHNLTCLADIDPDHLKVIFEPYSKKTEITNTLLELQKYLRTGYLGLETLLKKHSNIGQENHAPDLMWFHNLQIISEIITHLTLIKLRQENPATHTFNFKILVFPPSPTNTYVTEVMPYILLGFIRFLYALLEEVTSEKMKPYDFMVFKDLALKLKHCYEQAKPLLASTDTNNLTYPVLSTQPIEWRSINLAKFFQIASKIEQVAIYDYYHQNMQHGLDKLTKLEQQLTKIN